MKMKRTLSVLTVLAVSAALILGLAACGGSGGSSSDSSENASAEPNITENSGEQSETVPATPAASTREYVLENEVIVDDENLLIRIDRVEEDSIFGPEVKIYCENRSDASVHVSQDQAVVNGYSVSTLWGEDIADGMNVTGTIDFVGLDADKGLDVIDELQLYLRAYPSDDWSADDLLNDVYTVYPTGLSAESVNYPEPALGSNPVTIDENDQARFIIYGANDDPIWGYTVLAYMENNTDDFVMFSWDDVSVNGSMCDPFWAKMLAPHTAGYAEISFLSSDFEENGIETVENITFSLTVSNYSDWTAPDILDGIYTYEP